MRNVKGHAIRWYATNAQGERTPRASWMQNGDFAWDATCSCGWVSDLTDIMPAVDRLVIAHKAEAFAALDAPAAPAVVLPEPVQTKSPFTLTVAGQSTTFSRKDRAVACGEKIGQPFTVTNPKGNVVHTA